MIVRIAALAFVMMTSAPQAALAQTETPNPNQWRPVVYSDLQLPGERALPFASLWADELKRNNDAYKVRGDTRWIIANAPATESHVVVRSPQRTAVLSVLHTVTACRVIRSDPPHATLKSCPMRLAIYQDERSSVGDAGRGCFIEYGARPANAAPDLVRNAALASYDPENRTIRAGIVFKGEAIDECRFSVSVPQP